MAEASGGTASEDYGSEPIDLHPEILPLFSSISNLDPPMEKRPPAEVREIMDSSALRNQPPRSGDVVTKDYSVELPGRIIRTRLYKPKGAQGVLPVMLYFHGGGFAIGNLDTHDRYVCYLTKTSGVAYVAVEYRLSPEHPYPAANDDAFDSLMWVYENAKELGVDPDRIGLSGDSAGGSLIAACAIEARDRGNVPDIKFQLHIYPGGLTDDYTGRSFHRWKGLLLTTPYSQWFRKLRAAPSEDPRAFPLKAKDLRGLPPAYVVTCEYDIVRDQGEEFAMALMDASVPVTLRRVPRMAHPFFRAMHVSPYVRREMREMGRQIRAHLVETDDIPE